MAAEADTRIEELLDLYGVRVRNYCARRIPADRVEDAVADVFAVAWRKIENVPREPDALPWLYGVAYRVIFHHWRQTGRQTRLRTKVLALAIPPDDIDVAEVIVFQEDCILVREAAARLRPVDQEVLRLAMWEEVKRQDIANALGISQGAVNQRLHRARTNLAREFRRLSETSRPTAATEKGASS